MTINEKVETIKNNIEVIIKEDDNFFNTNIDFILVNPDNNDTISIVSDGIEKIVQFTDDTLKYDYIFEWSYNFDEYLFQNLQQGYQIGYMSDINHCGVWKIIDELYPNDIVYKDGMQKYLQYCLDNKITKEYLDNETRLDTPNIMKYYDNTPLRKNSNYYDVYIEKNNTNHNNEKEYFVFILGYDLLQDIFKCSTVQECDYIYDFCNYEVEKFLKSKEYQNLRYSGYDMLDKWVTRNKKLIINDFQEFIGGEFMIYNGNIKIINNGFRREQPIAFVEKTLDNNEKEYIIAFGYKTKENNIFWDYGYYYGNNKNNAEKDFNKVLNGGNLDRTFKDIGER